MFTVTFHNRQTGDLHSYDLHRGQRRDRYDVRRDGQPWRTVTATWFAAAIRRKLAPHDL